MDPLVWSTAKGISLKWLNWRSWNGSPHTELTKMVKGVLLGTITCHYKRHHRNLLSQPLQPHKVRGFADDLTIILSSSTDHVEALKTIPDSCQDLDLTLKPQKAYCLFLIGRWSSQPHLKLAEDPTEKSHQVQPSFWGSSRPHRKNLTPVNLVKSSPLFSNRNLKV